MRATGFQAGKNLADRTPLELLFKEVARSRRCRRVVKVRKRATDHIERWQEIRRDPINAAQQVGEPREWLDAVLGGADVQFLPVPRPLTVNRLLTHAFNFDRAAANL